MEALCGHGKMDRTEIDKLIWDLLPAWMDSKRKNRIENLLRELRKFGKLVNERSGGVSVWHRPR